MTGEARGALSRGSAPPPVDEPQAPTAGFLGTIPWRSYRVPLAAGAILAVLALLAMAYFGARAGVALGGVAAVAAAAWGVLAARRVSRTELHAEVAGTPAVEELGVGAA